MIGDHSSHNAEIAIGATGAVIATDQLLEATDPDHEDKTRHLVKASIGAAVAIGAWELYRRGEQNEKRRSRSLSRSRSITRSVSRSRSGGRPRSPSSKRIKHHKRHVLEEIVGAYSLGKELLGDKHHHIAHLVGEALGATAVIKELKARDKFEGEDEGRLRR
ncbi:hypothetical protein DL98DRAFT_522189 [Cadophora sp. DSE1049]|nr:hypothetical protein DL98DRAFT_522189 [Cadophora sp. DSE1049]